MTRRIFASLLAAPIFRRFRKKPEVDFRIPIIIENRKAFVDSLIDIPHTDTSLLGMRYYESYGPCEHLGISRAAWESSPISEKDFRLPFKRTDA